MKKSVLAALAVAGLASVALARPVVTFDDLVGAGGVPAGYGGVASWGSWSYYDGDQPPYTAQSSFERIYDSFGSPSVISFGGVVTFDGAYFAGYGEDDGIGAGNLQWTLWLGGVQVGASGFIDPSSTPVYLPSGYSGPVDQVMVSSSIGGAGYGYFIVDNFTYNVPAPASVLAFSTLGLAGLRRRR